MIAETVAHRRDWPRLRLGGVAAFALATLFLAGIVHICTILLVPLFADRDGWSRLAAAAGQGAFAELAVEAPSGATVVGLDPLFVTGACRLTLSDDPASIALEARERFWSLALYDRRGTVIFSLNDRTAIEGRLDMLVVNPAQAAEIRRTAPPEFEQTIVVESLSDELIALLRLYAPTERVRDEARRILTGAECIPTTVDPAAVSPAATGSGG